MKISIHKNLKSMTGVGEEWLVDDKDNVRVVFIDGNMSCQIFAFNNSTDITKDVEIENDKIIS